MMRPAESYPEEERKLPAIEAHSEELRFDPLLFNNVIVVRRLHFLSQNEKYSRVTMSNDLISHITDSMHFLTSMDV